MDIRLSEPKVEIAMATRLCRVEGKIGYFHTWKYYSRPLPASPFVGGEPAGMFSRVFGIVEFPDGVERVDPTDIHFCDDGNKILTEWNKSCEEKENNGDEKHF